MKIEATVAVMILITSFPTAQAGPSALWARRETNAATPQMVESTAGTVSMTLPFTGTTNYDFFSAPLTSSISLTTADKGGGIISLRNTAPVGAFDFSVKGQMRYFDYNPATGVETLILDTGVSPQKNINHGQTVNWPMPNEPLSAAKTVSAGHLLHVSVTVILTAGYPWTFGSLVYNVSTGTQGQLPQNRVIALPFGPLRPVSPASISGSAAPSGGFSIILSGVAGASYTIQATTNLNNPVWASLVTTNTGTNGLVVFKDVDASKYPCRFYRSAQ
jgi:hypothetical protein